MNVFSFYVLNQLQILVSGRVVSFVVKSKSRKGVDGVVSFYLTEKGKKFIIARRYEPYRLHCHSSLRFVSLDCFLKECERHSVSSFSFPVDDIPFN